MTAHKLVDRQPDPNDILKDIKAVQLSVDSRQSDDYEIARMGDYFNDWWQEGLGFCRESEVSGMLPKSSVQDVMDLVEGHFSHLVSDPTPDPDEI
jgi:hypothetical protein